MKTVFVGNSNQATIICPKCGLTKNIDATNFKNTKKRLKAKCKCSKVFQVTFEFRKHYRKNVRLPGEYIVRWKGEKGGVIIRDLSLGGIRFESLNQHQILPGDTLDVKFNLDNPMKSEIRKQVKGIWVRDSIVGAQYSVPKSYGKDSGFYLRT